MGSQSLLDRAANLRDKIRAVAALVDEIKSANGEWVGLAMTADEAIDGAGSGLQHAWMLLNHIEQLASLELERAKAKAA